MTVTPTFLSARGITLDASGNIYVSEALRIRRITPDGRITTVAGNGQVGFCGDGGPATAASFNYASLAGPSGIAVDSAGNIYMADAGNFRIRKISTSGIITTLAGNGAYRFSAEGIPATTAFYTARKELL